MHAHTLPPADTSRGPPHYAQLRGASIRPDAARRPRPGHAGHDEHAGHDPEMFRRRFWLSLLLTVPLVVTSEMVMDWFGYELDFRGHRVARAGARLGRVLVGRLAVPRRRRGRGPRPPAGDDAADLDGDHGRLRGVDGDQPRAGSTSSSGGSWPRW